MSLGTYRAAVQAAGSQLACMEPADLFWFERLPACHWGRDSVLSNLDIGA